MTAIKKGNIYIISAASGTGKSTLVQRLLLAHTEIKVSVSHTTRQPRIGEQDGIHYHFVSTDNFKKLISNNAFLEYAEVFGNFYGTNIQTLKELTAQGFDVILEIDVQGAAQVREKLPESISIFVLPPSLAILEQRLRNRQTDSEEVIARRLNEATNEIAQATLFDYLIINDDLDTAEADLYSIFRANRLHSSNARTMIENLLQNP